MTVQTDISVAAADADAAATARSRRVPGGLVLGWRQYLFWLTFLRRTWRGTVLSALIGPVLYLTAMGVGIGTLVDRGHGLPGGVNYVSFIAPGVLAATAMQNGIFDGAFPVLGSLKWNGNYWAAMNTPQRPQDIMLGTAMQGLVRILGVSVVFYAAMELFGAVHSAWGPLALPAVVLTGAVFLFAMMAFTVTIDSDQPINVVFRFVMTPLFLFSGTFFPWQQLPAWMHPVAFATPLWQGVELSRELTLGTADAGSVLLHLGYLLAALALAYGLARRNFRRRLYLAR
jgi:lipooligosaccharide transport system permease protein